MAARPRVLAIDGPAASGKSSTAAAVARELGLLHVDSGALYRALALVGLEAGETRDGEAIVQAAEARGLTLRPDGGTVEVLLDGRPAEDRIRSEAVTAAVSPVSAIPRVREWVNTRLRRLEEHGRGLVMDGRDIGTAVFPDAPCKVYLDARPDVRARRRLEQWGRSPAPDDVAAEASRIEARDRADRSRAVAPLRRADDAVVLDTSTLGFGQQVAAIVELARAAGLSRGPERR